MVNENGKTPAEIDDFEEKCERYLLGELPEPELEEFEEAYFADDKLFERYLAVKDELLDSSARGELPPEKLARLARHFQSTSPRRRQLEETKDFIQAVTRAATVPLESENAPLPVVESRPLSQRLQDLFRFPQLVRVGALAALLILIGGVIWFVLRKPEPESAQVEQPVLDATPANQNNQQNNQINQQTGQINQQPTPDPMTPVDKNQNVTLKPTPGNANQPVVNVNPNSSNSNSNQPPANTNIAPEPTPVKPNKQPTPISSQIASILLSPVATRNIGSANTLRLSAETTSASLTLVFRSDDHRSYSVTITTVGGGSIFSQKGLKAVGSRTNKSITLQIAAANLRPQDYIVTVRGQTGAQTEVLAEYYFRVSRNSAQNP
jgi:hypothetical protein